MGLANGEAHFEQFLKKGSLAAPPPPPLSQLRRPPGGGKVLDVRDTRVREMLSVILTADFPLGYAWAVQLRKLAARELLNVEIADLAGAEAQAAVTLAHVIISNSIVQLLGLDFYVSSGSYKQDYGAHMNKQSLIVTLQLVHDNRQVHGELLVIFERRLCRSR